MSWQCWCGCVNANRCKWCNYCRARSAKISLRPKEYLEYEIDWVDEFIQNRRIWRLNKALGIDENWIREITSNSERKMTPREELFAKFFNATLIEVKDMDILTLRAFREQLDAIAYEARAKLAAADHAINERKPKNTDKGFTRSVNADDSSKETINRINERTKKLTRQDKILQGLISMGMNPKEAESVMTSGKILERVKSATADQLVPESANATEVKTEKKAESFNPFAKKSEN